MHSAVLHSALRSAAFPRPASVVLHSPLIDGVWGGVGKFAIQIAKSFGVEVTAVRSTSNVDRARSIGVDHVIDYTQEDFTKSGARYDLIPGANAHHACALITTAARG